MRHFFMEVHHGLDIVEFIISFSRTGFHTVVTVLSASGMVTNVALQHGGLLSNLTDPHRLVSLSGSFIALSDGEYSGCLSTILAFTSGQLISGLVAGSILAAGPVVVVLAAAGGTPPVIRPPINAAAGGNPPVIRPPLLAPAGNQRDSDVRPSVRQFNAGQPAQMSVSSTLLVKERRRLPRRLQGMEEESYSRKLLKIVC